MRTLDDQADFTADAQDRRAALDAAVRTAGYGSCDDQRCGTDNVRHILHVADDFYRWLGRRDTLRAVALTLTPGTPHPEGTNPMDTTFTLPDSDEVVFTVGGVDAKGAAVAAPEDTWSYSLSDPDSSGAVATPSGDTLSCVVAAGNPTPNLALTASGANSGLVATVAIDVTAGPPAGITLVPGTPSAEPPPA